MLSRIDASTVPAGGPVAEVPFQRSVFEKSLQVLVGEPLTDFWVPIHFVFEFGKQVPALNRKSEEVPFGKYTLGIASAWHVTNGPIVVLGSGDYERRPVFLSRKTPPRDAALRARWMRAKEFQQKIKQGSLVVESVKVLPGPKLVVQLSEGYRIASIITITDGLPALWGLRVRATDQSTCADSRKIWTFE